MIRKISLTNLQRKWLLLLPLLLVIALTASACATGVSEDRVAALESQIGKVSEPTKERHFYVTGVEWKGTTSADSLDPPTVDPSTLSDGYGFNPTGFDSGNPRNWRVATYVWTPASMIAYEGDKISLTIFIVNGNKHTTWIEAPDGSEAVSEIEMNRGREYKLSFTAGKPGTYILHCDEHDPTMTGYIQVLPRA